MDLATVLYYKASTVCRVSFIHHVHSANAELRTNPKFQSTTGNRAMFNIVVRSLTNVLLCPGHLGNLQRKLCRRFARAVCMLYRDTTSYQAFLQRLECEKCEALWDIITGQSDMFFKAEASEKAPSIYFV